MKLRKLLALVLALAMVLSGSVVALAEENDPGESQPLEGDGSEYYKNDMNVLRMLLENVWDDLPTDVKKGRDPESLVEDELPEDAWWDGDIYTNEERNAKISVGWANGRIEELFFANILDRGPNSFVFSELTELKVLDCGGNSLSSLDVSGCTQLQNLRCNDNWLSSLNVSDCSKLEYLDVNFNELTSLNVSACKELQTLIAHGNELTSLNVSGCSKLKYLDVYYNHLTGLDLSTCVALTSLDCRHNNLPSKDAVKFASSLKMVWDKGTLDEYGNPKENTFLFTPQGRGNAPSTPLPTHEESTKDTTDESNHRAESAAIEAVEAAMEAISEGKTPAKVQNVTTAAGATIPAVSVKLYGIDAYLSVDSMETMADASVGLQVNLNNGAAGILIPGGFPFVDEPMRMSYLLGYKKDPYNTDLMKSFVRTPDAKTEVYKLGGGTLPTTATVTLKTKLTGPVNIYHWDEDTRRVTLLTTTTAGNGKMIFATKQLGNLIITTGTI